MTLPNTAMSQHKRMAQGDKNIGFKAGGAVGARTSRPSWPVQGPKQATPQTTQKIPCAGMKNGGKAGGKK